jgi:hypothetical protein
MERLYNAVSLGMTSMGLALLILSLLLVPSSRALADDGGGGGEAGGCIGGQQLCSPAGANGCYVLPSGSCYSPPTGDYYQCSTYLKGCAGCHCRGNPPGASGSFTSCTCQN